MISKTILAFTALMLSGQILFAQSVEPELSKKLNDYISDQQALLGDRVKIHVHAEREADGSPVYSYNEESFIHMASVQKLLITYASLKILGPSYTFPTEIYSNWSIREQSNDLDSGIAEGQGYKNKKIPDVVIYIRPYGDPLFQYEDALKISRELLARGYYKINKLVLDKSLFFDPEEVKGRESYLASQTSAAIEFNTFKIDIIPSSSGSDALYQVSKGFYGEISQKVKTLKAKGSNLEISITPDFNSFLNRGFPPKGPWRPTKFKLALDGKIGLNDPIYTEYLAHPEPDTLYINSFKKALEANGITVGDEIEYGLVPEEARLVYEHQSAPLSQILKKLNHYSNNFIAGQLLYSIGQDKNGIFRKEIGYQNLLDVLGDVPDFIIPQDKSKMVIKDASGLSTENRISPRQVTRVLRAASEDISIYPTFIASLPRLGHDGSLSKRQLINNKDEYNVRTSFFIDLERRVNGIWAKPGSVEGISSIAGFIEPQSKQRLVFSIALVGLIKKNDASKIEDDIIKIVLGMPDKSKAVE